MKIMTERDYMDLSIEVMKKSQSEKRKDKKPCPKVGAILVRQDGSVETAYRSELREGDHAEYTLIERKCRAEKLDGATLYATLEPCAPGSRHFPKLGCAERIVNARIKKVYVGIEDPDPTVCRKGIQYLLENGIEVEMYPQELQDVITKENEEFLSAANERARLVAEEKTMILSGTEKRASNTELNELDEKQINSFFESIDLDCLYGDEKSNNYLSQLGILSNENGTLGPTGIGLLLFGKQPELKYPNARIKALYIDEEDHEEIKDFGGSILKQPQAVIDWVKEKIDKWIERGKARREVVYSYPIVVISELVKNAIVHRDYDIEGAPIFIEINKDCIIIKSPGLPVPPLTMDQIYSFNAPSLSRNPKIMFVFDAMGLAEQRGLGFKTVKQLPSKYDIPLPLVTYEKPYMVFTLPRSSSSDLFNGEKELNIKAMDYLRMNPNAKRKDLEVALGTETKKTERVLKALVEQNLVTKNGKGKGTTYVLNDTVTPID